MSSDVATRTIGGMVTPMPILTSIVDVNLADQVPAEPVPVPVGSTNLTQRMTTQASMVSCASLNVFMTLNGSRTSTCNYGQVR